MYVVSIINERNGKTYFNRCGVGFRNKDGSINFKLDVFGDTQFHIREARSDAEEIPQEAENGGQRTSQQQHRK